MKTVIITGAGGNLGTAVTRRFLEYGYRVISTVSNEQGKKEMPQHENLHVEAVDLTNEDQASRFISDTIAAYRQVHAALLLVGGFTMGKISDTGGEVLRKQISLNFETAYYIARPLLQHMISNENGRLVFIGARPALQPADAKNMIAYALSKSLLFNLAEVINKEGKGKNVSAAVVVPSTIDTEINRKSMPDANPDNWVKPAQLAELLEFVVSDKASALRETVLKVYNNA
jgi:NAD(P)-dependent dehydrogenase (short-subunit alcohol dehydrogenase family)